MTCRNSFDKLWNNYLSKYGDYRERLQSVLNDSPCSIQHQALRISRKNFVRKRSPSLPSQCCHLPSIKHDFSFLLNQTDLNALEEFIDDENFPENIFPANVQPRSSTTSERESSLLNTSHRSSSKRLTSLLDTLFSKNTLALPMTSDREESSMYSSHQSLKKTSNQITTPRLPSGSDNPYKQLLERLRQSEKPKVDTAKFTVDHRAIDSTLNYSNQILPTTKTRINEFLSFLQSLDDSPIDKLDADTLLALFALDNHLSSAIYVPTTVQPIHLVPKTILHSLKNTPQDKQIFHEVQSNSILAKFKQEKAMINMNTRQTPWNNPIQPTKMIEQDRELNSKLRQSYAVQAFRDFIIHDKTFRRLPKLFHDLEQYHQNSIA